MQKTLNKNIPEIESAPFTLWRGAARIFPTTLSVDGVWTEINPDFRVILKILKLHWDNEIHETRKAGLMLGWFYRTVQPHPLESLNALIGFIAPPEEVYDDPTRQLYKHKKDGAGQRKPPKYCFEFDAEEIYISFLQDYKIDLIETEYMHWYKFLIMFSNLSKNTAFQRKMDLRTMDLKDFKGRERARMQKAQKAVQIPVKYNATELQMVNELMKTLMK